jgi:hypothetical protein
MYELIVAPALDAEIAYCDGLQLCLVCMYLEVK